MREGLRAGERHHVGGWNGDYATNTISGTSISSPNRLLYAFPVYFGVYVDGPSWITSTGNHTCEAFPSGGDGTHTYQWSIYYRRWGFSQSLGTAKTQSLYVYKGDGDFDIRVTVTSGGQTKSSSAYVYNGGPGGGCSTDPYVICHVQ